MNSDSLFLRDLQTKDVRLLLDYWYRSPPGFIESLGVDLSKLPPEPVMRASWLRACAENEILSSEKSQMRSLVVLHEGRPVGTHVINNIVARDSATFHAHFWDANARGKGIGTLSYPKACEIYFKRFGLKRILFQTPIHNVAAIRVKEKLGIRYIGDEIIGGTGAIKAGTQAMCFELLLAELSAILERARQISISRNF